MFKPIKWSSFLLSLYIVTLLSIMSGKIYFTRNGDEMSIGCKMKLPVLARIETIHKMTSEKNLICGSNYMFFFLACWLDKLNGKSRRQHIYGEKKTKIAHLALTRTIRTTPFERTWIRRQAAQGARRWRDFIVLYLCKIKCKTINGV